MKKPTDVRRVRRGEPLAIAPDYLHTGPEAIFWMFGSTPRENEYLEGGVAVVTVDGPLEHRAEGFGDSYEAIGVRMQEALDHEESSVVVLRLSSPGGVVAGLNEAVYKLQRAAKAAGKKVIAYVDEMAASAAFALACAAEEIILPPSGICGSVGVISSMADVVKRDQKEGVNYVIITSGKRKADGHVHAAISTDAVNVERARVEKFALQFFQLAGKARGLSVGVLRKLEAGIFVGQDAVRVGLADAVMGWDELIETLKDIDTAQNPGSGKRETSDVSRSDKGNVTKREEAMSIALAAKIKETRAALVAATDDKKRARLASRLAAFMTTEAMLAGKDDDDKDEEEDEEESAESDDSSKGGKSDKGSDKGDDDDDEEEDDEEEDEEESAKDDDDEEEEAAATSPALLASAQLLVKSKSGRAALAKVFAHAAKLTGQSSPREVLGALSGMKRRLANADAVSGRVAQLEKNERGAKVDAMLKEARRDGKVTKKMAANLRSQGMRDPKWLKGHLAVLPAIVRSRDEGPLAEPVVDGRPPARGAVFGAPSNRDQEAMEASAAAAAGMTLDAYRAQQANLTPKPLGMSIPSGPTLNGKPLAS